MRQRGHKKAFFLMIFLIREEVLVLTRCTKKGKAFREKIGIVMSKSKSYNKGNLKTKNSFRVSAKRERKG